MRGLCAGLHHDIIFLLHCIFATLLKGSRRLLNELGCGAALVACTRDRCIPSRFQCWRLTTGGRRGNADFLIFIGNHPVCCVLESLSRWHHGSVFVLLEVQLEVIADVHQILELGQWDARLRVFLNDVKDS